MCMYVHGFTLFQCLCVCVIVCNEKKKKGRVCCIRQVFMQLSHIWLMCMCVCESVSGFFSASASSALQGSGTRGWLAAFPFSFPRAGFARQWLFCARQGGGGMGIILKHTHTHQKVCFGDVGEVGVLTLLAFVLPLMAMMRMLINHNSGFWSVTLSFFSFLSESIHLHIRCLSGYSICGDLARTHTHTCGLQIIITALHVKKRGERTTKCRFHHDLR